MSTAHAMGRRRLKRRYFESRFAAIWFALALLVIVSLISAPATLERGSLSAISPLVAFLAIAAMGQALVVMTGGIDLSIPSVITLVGFILVKASGGSDADMPIAIVAALVAATGIGLVNGLLVTLFRLNSLVVTLAVGTVVSGATLWYRGGVLPEAAVPPALAAWGDERFFIFNYFVVVALGVMLLLAVVFNYTAIGRRFMAVGANPGAAWVAGIPVERYQIGAYTAAGLLYGVTGILISAFLKSLSLEIGNPYLLSTVVVVVLGGALLSGGPASSVATVAAVVFITLLNQMLRVQGFSTAVQSLTQGIALACAMALANAQFQQLNLRFLKAIRIPFGRFAGRL